MDYKAEFLDLRKKIIENSLLDAKDNNNGEVTPFHLFSALLEEGEGIAVRILVGMNINIDELYFGCKEDSIKVCTNCGYTTEEDFIYCPKCSNKL